MRNWIVETWKKVAGTIKVAAFEHTKVMVITSCVVVAGATGTGVTIATVIHRNNAIQANAETVQETTQEHTMLPTVAATTEAETKTEEETSTEAEIEAMLASGNVELIAMENLNIVDVAADERGQDEVVGASDGLTGTVDPEGLYEINDLVYGVDVSEWQGDIDWTAVAQSGVKFAMIRCGGRTFGGGVLYEDNYFDQNMQGAIANGIQVGVYFYSQACSAQEAFEEASMTINKASKYQIAYPIAMDYEANADHRIRTLSMEQRTEYAQIFCDTIASAGYQTMLYSFQDDLNNRIDTNSLANKYKIWLSSTFYKYLPEYPEYYEHRLYELGDKLPSTSYTYQMWQYGKADFIPGIGGSGIVDVNIAFFGYSGYQVDNIQNAKITTPSDTLTMIAGGVEPDIHTDVKAVNCIGYEVEYDTYIYNSNGDSIDAATAFANVGTYKISYSFKDPKDGEITKDVVLNVTERNAAITLTTSSYEVEQNLADASVNLREGMTARNHKNEDVTEEVTVTVQDANGTVSSIEDAFKTAGTYTVVYTYEDEKQGSITSKASLTVLAMPTEEPSTEAPSTQIQSTAAATQNTVAE